MSDYCKCGTPLIKYNLCERCNLEIELSRLRILAKDTDDFDLAAFDLASKVKVFTVDSPITLKIIEEYGIVQGGSSKVAFWGLSKQMTRLSNAYDIAILNIKSEAAKLGANGIVGVRFALNNSTGSAAAIAGSSEAVMLIGTAVKLAKTDID